MNDIKTVLLHLDASPGSARRLGIVKPLATAHGACIEAVYSVMPVLMQYPLALSADGSVASQLAAWEAESRDTAKAAFERECAAAGLTDIPWRQTDDDPVRGFRRHAWVADLLVLAQHDPRAQAPAGVQSDFVASVLVETGKPGLVLPYIDVAPDFGRNVLVAWKATPESARALSAALPILKRADSVHVATWDEADNGGADAAMPAVQFLRRHGVAAITHRGGHQPTRDLGELLLSQAADLQSDLLVMGCYGHGRAREWALGGVTRTVLESMTLPVLMVH